MHLNTQMHAFLSGLKRQAVPKWDGLHKRIELFAVTVTIKVTVTVVIKAIVKAIDKVYVTHAVSPITATSAATSAATTVSALLAVKDVHRRKTPAAGSERLTLTAISPVVTTALSCTTTTTHK